jgi:hypothetical protein
LGAVPFAIEAMHAAEAARAESAPGTVPVGAVVAWHKDLLPPAERVLPEGFVECNGQEITDEDSPFYRGAVPDLNGTSRFLRGSSESGGTGGTASASHSHRWLLGGVDYNHGPTWSADGGVASIEGMSGPNPNGSMYNWAFYWMYGHQLTDKYTSAELIETQPPYMDVIWIIRIK